jgi:hypothetical protein
MRGLHSKFKILQDSLKAHLAKNSAKWKVFLYSIPAMALFAPLAALASEAAAVPGGGGKAVKFIKAAGGAAAGFGKDVAVAGFGGLLQSGIETTGSLAVWIFIANQLSKLFADLFSGIFLFLINFLIGVSQYNSFLGANVVTIGWAVTRDIANMFLVVALLVIAFATILNINSYQASSLLKQFFFSAILVNFSKMICGVLIDASQVVMMTFVSGFAETAGGNFVRLFKIDGWLQLALGTAKSQAPGSGSGAVDSAATFATWVASSDFFTGIATNIFTAIISFIGILAILSLDIILVVRIVTIWFLVVAAPIAFVAKVLPVTKGFSSQWWSAFMKQLIAGPLVAFIVWISLASIAVSDNAFDLTSEARQKNALFAEANNTPSSKGQIVATKISQWENLALFFVPIVIFIMGAKWAVGVAGGAAKSITGFANKKLSGYATGGLRAFQKQAIGKGDFSVMSQAKKGWKGEGGFTTAALGGIGGYALGKMGTPGKAVSTFGSKLVGDRARAEQRDGRKGLANTASKFGLGDLGHKRHDVHNADADAEMYRERARKAEANKDTAAAELNRSLAMQAIKKVESTQEEIFKADGLVDDKAILKHLTDAEDHGHVSESALAVGKKLIGDSYDKKFAAALSKAKVENFDKRDKEIDEMEARTDLDSAVIEANVKRIRESYKWDTSKNNEFERTFANSDDGKPKRDVTRLHNRYLNPTKAAEDEQSEKVKNDARVAREAQIKTAKDIRTENEAQAKARAAEQQRTQAENDQRRKEREEQEAVIEQSVREAEVTMHVEETGIRDKYKSELERGSSPDTVKKSMAHDIASNTMAAQGKGVSDAEIKASIGRSLQLVHPKDRDAVVAEMKLSFGSNASLSSVLDAAHGEINQITPAAARAKIDARRVERDAQGPDFSLKDFGAVKDRSGKMHLPQPAISELTKAIMADPKIIARFSSATSSHPDVQQAILHSVGNMDDVLNIVSEIQQNSDGNRGEVVARVRNLSSVLERSGDPTINSSAGSLENFL